jgi:heme A synthase
MLLRLRIWHPFLAIGVGFYLIFASALLGMFRQDPAIKRLSIALVVLFVIQLGAGIVNLLLLAPVWMQITHLLLADLVWITLVLLAGNTFASGEARQPARERQPGAVPRPGQAG